MDKKKWKIAAAGAVAAGAGAAVVIAQKKKKENNKTDLQKTYVCGTERNEYRNTERGKYEKNKKGIYYSNGNYEAFARRRSRKGWRKRTPIS